MSTMITEKLIAIAPEELARSIEPYKINKKGVQSFELTLSLSSNNKDRKLQKVVNFEAKVNPNRPLSDDSAYDNLIDYLRYSYEKYVTPFFVSLCKVGDFVQVSSEIDKDGLFVNDHCKVKVSISIPNEAKENWAVYIEQRYKELAKFHDFLERIDFEIQFHKFARITLTYDFEMVPEQTFTAIQSRSVDDNVAGDWHNLAWLVEKRHRKENNHTHTISCEKTLTEFGAVMEICSETVKTRIS